MPGIRGTDTEVEIKQTEEQLRIFQLKRKLTNEYEAELSTLRSNVDQWNVGYRKVMEILQGRGKELNWSEEQIQTLVKQLTAIDHKLV